MDDVTRQTTQNLPTTPSDDITHITVELYKKNFALIQSNKTLSILGNINEIILSAVTDTKEIAQKVADMLIADAGFKIVAIFFVDKQNNTLNRLAVAQIGILQELSARLQNESSSIIQHLDSINNIILETVKLRKMMITHNLHDVLKPMITEEETKVIEETGGITTSVVYPLIVREELIGTMLISLGAPENNLPQYQKDLIDRLVNTVGIAINDAFLYEHIRKTNERLKQVDELKDEFVNLASHELRSPLTIIKGYLSTFMDESKDEFSENLTKQSKFTDIQKKCIIASYETTQSLLQLINEMLDISRIESGKLELNIQPTDLIQLTDNIIAEMSSIAKQQGINLTVTKPVSSPMVLADKDKTKEVTMNLISNGIKFTQNGGSVSLFFTDDKNYFTVHIKDSGRGLSKDDMNKLFQKFSRIEKSDSLQPKGTGLGLYLSKEIIEAENGKIWVESEGENKGSIFSFSLKKV